jgi:hypothetical protein
MTKPMVHLSRLWTAGTVGRDVAPREMRGLRNGEISAGNIRWIAQTV